MKKNMVLRYVGFMILMIGVFFNLKMIYDKAWPTYIFMIICLIGLLQILISFLMKGKTIGWQFFFIVTSFILSYLVFRYFF
jgi:hypothetical protein